MKTVCDFDISIDNATHIMAHIYPSLRRGLD